MLISSFIVYSIIAMLTQSYISLVNSQLLYCSQIWRPVLIKDIQSLEQIQHWATKFILNDFHTSDKSQLQLQDIMFFVKTLKQSALSPAYLLSCHMVLYSNNNNNYTVQWVHLGSYSLDGANLEANNVPCFHWVPSIIHIVNLTCVSRLYVINVFSGLHSLLSQHYSGKSTFTAWTVNCEWVQICTN